MNPAKKRLKALEIIEAICKRVRKFGDQDNIETWRAAFSDKKYEGFFEVDSNFSNKPIFWQSRSIIEKAMFVVYKNYYDSMEIVVILEVNGKKIRAVITDQETIWTLWMIGCFKTLNPKQTLPKKVLKFLYDQTEDKEYISEMDTLLDRGWVFLLDLEVFVLFNQ